MNDFSFYIKIGFLVLAVIFIKYLFTLLEGKIFPKKKLQYSKKQLLTNAEINFFESLRIMIGDNYYVYPQIPTAEILKPWDRKIAQKRIDFVVFDKNYDPILAIELDDYTHQREDRKARDAFIDDACDSAGIGTIHCKTSDIPNLKEKLAQYLK